MDQSGRDFRYRIRPPSRRPTLVHRSETIRTSDSLKKPALMQTANCVSSSAKETLAIYRNFSASLFVPFELPSAIFEGTETAARLN